MVSTCMRGRSSVAINVPDEVSPESRSHKRHVSSADEEQTHSKLGSDTRPVTPAECAWNV